MRSFCLRDWRSLVGCQTVLFMGFYTAVVNCMASRKHSENVYDFVVVYFRRYFASVTSVLLHVLLFTVTPLRLTAVVFNKKCLLTDIVTEKFTYLF